jgi:hypothetical protein
MKNVDFLVQILTSSYEYWVVARENVDGRDRRSSDDIMIISIPPTTTRYSSKEEILFTDLEKLYRSDVSNIFITGNYPPFQLYVTMRNMYTGYPIKRNVRKFLADALNLNSNDIYKYKELLEQAQYEVKEAANEN